MGSHHAFGFGFAVVVVVVVVAASTELELELELELERVVLFTPSSCTILELDRSTAPRQRQLAAGTPAPSHVRDGRMVSSTDVPSERGDRGERGVARPLVARPASSRMLVCTSYGVTNPLAFATSGS
jgi:hypothetical protein